jgi:hypothetical protein
MLLLFQYSFVNVLGFAKITLLTRSLNIFLLNPWNFRLYSFNLWKHLIGRTSPHS